MTLPLAANPTSPTPGFWLVVDLEPATVAPGAQGLRALIVGPKNASGGDITANTEIRDLSELEDAETAAGIGSLPALAYAALIARDKAAQVQLICPTASAGDAAAGGFALSGTVVDGTARLFVHGVKIEVPIYAGEALTVWRTRAVDIVGRYAHLIHYTPTAGVADGAIILTAKSTGPAGNDGVFRCELVDASGMGLAATQPTGGTTEPDYATALTTADVREYDYIVPCMSNADVVSATGGAVDIADHINGLNTGLGAKLQQGIIGCSGTVAASKTSTAALNDQVMEFLTITNAEALPCQIAGDELGDRMAKRRLQSSANRIGNEIGVPGSSDPVSDTPTLPESDDALSHGVSIASYNDAGQPYLMRAVTTYHLTSGGSSVLCTDCNEIDALYDIAKDLRAFLPQEYRGVHVTQTPTGATDTPQDELPENTVETSTIRGSIVSRIENYWVPKGTVDRAAFRAVVDDGTLAVNVNGTDATQVDIFIPLLPSKNLSKLGVYIRKTG